MSYNQKEESYLEDPASSLEPWIEDALRNDPGYTLPEDFASRIVKKTEPAYLDTFLISSFALVILALLFFSLLGLQLISDIGYISQWMHQLGSTVEQLVKIVPMNMIVIASSIVTIFTLWECFQVKSHAHG